MGICCVGRYNGCYIVISEFVHTKYKNGVSTLLLMFECIVSMVLALYFKFISKNWIYILSFGASLNLIFLIGCYFIPESPEYLYSYYKFRETKRTFEFIAKFNKVKMNQSYMFDSEYEMKALRHMI